jgi:hypothetical protein
VIRADVSPIGDWAPLEQALETIIDQPQHYWQADWVTELPIEVPVADLDEFYQVTGLDEDEVDIDIENAAERGKCGTTRCVAGWVAYQQGYETYIGGGMAVHPDRPETFEYIVDVALRSLQPKDLTNIYPYPDGESLIRHKLFGGYQSWPEILAAVAIWARADGHTLSAKITAEIKKQLPQEAWS